MEISAARYEYLYTVGGATRKREVELQLHGKMEIISYVQIDSNLRYPTQFSLYVYMWIDRYRNIYLQNNFLY